MSITSQQETLLLVGTQADQVPTSLKMLHKEHSFFNQEKKKKKLESYV